MNQSEILKSMHTSKLPYFIHNFLVDLFSSNRFCIFILSSFSHRRNFNEELNAQKLVRLVFNGHVLQPDAKTIAACGLFDNCVVHCLIHNPRPNVVTEPNTLANNQPIPLVNEGMHAKSILTSI